ncbi:hypothetical protein BS50DRAFT_140766 [Corynespora cassiicola Philippines]|uniref:Uncharacterized protein n=1 Tax=Corynespora cassiicola Philippines TaxID=1448308 RepID=A0A2T2NB00_CORCC|nr:hypothetical protein BS50DRAFT_140766 [Corynespora cassiicola Philippines]
MGWFSRRQKLKEGRATAVEPPASTHTQDAPSTSSKRRRTRRTRRTSSRSTTSMRDVDKNSPNLLPAGPHANAPFPNDGEDITALPFMKRLEQSPHLRPVSTHDHGIQYNFHPSSNSSLPTARERGKLQRPQSLHKRSINDSSLIRRKSSKRREHDPVREEEIRAMSVPLPLKRPAASSGGMLRRDSKKVKGGLNHRFERPTSNVSLPLEDSIHSSMSGNSELRAFRVSALDMFSPRPTLRYSVGSQYYYGSAGASPTAYPTITESHKEYRNTNGDGSKRSRRTSRIDDLADTLDAGALREILDRDKRRKEKKRKADEERLRRRLERRAEKQRAADQKAVEVGGTPATPRKTATGAIGLGIDKDAPTPMEDVRPTTPTRQPQQLHTPVTPSRSINNQLPTPLDSPVEEAVISNAHTVRYSRGSVSGPQHTRGPSNVSQMPELLSERLAQETPAESVEHAQDPTRSGSLHPVETADTTATSKMGSSRRRSSEGKRMGVFASFFRRKNRSAQDQARVTPSEASFSNTSRESMSRQPLPPHLVAAGPTQPIQIRRPSSIPRRTMSKFREDLPEFPLSPPDSRVQSPEATSASGLAARRRNRQPADIQVESNSSAGNRTDSPVSPGVAATGLMSQSLASVDSEGSWLSGKPMQRRSNKSYLRSSVGSSSVAKKHEEFNASYEELGIPDDEYFKRLTPQPDERRRSGHSADLLARKASSTAMATMEDGAESDNDDEIIAAAADKASDDEELVKGGVARQPTIVHRRPRVKSTEGLLSFWHTEKAQPEEKGVLGQASPEQDSPTSESEAVSLQRAKSVDLGKHHVRHLSAGSAKLLDIQKRSSSASASRPTEQE